MCGKQILFWIDQLRAQMTPKNPEYLTHSSIEIQARDDSSTLVAKAHSIGDRFDQCLSGIVVENDGDLRCEIVGEIEELLPR
jgi:hypothetical protein